MPIPKNITQSFDKFSFCPNRLIWEQKDDMMPLKYVEMATKI